MRLISKYGWIRTLHVATLRAKAFMRAPWAGGVVLLACVVAAMLLANLPATKIYYRHLLETELSVMVHSPTGGRSSSRFSPPISSIKACLVKRKKPANLLQHFSTIPLRCILMWLLAI